MTQKTNVNIRVAPLNGKLYLFVQTKGTSTQRKRLIPGIEEPDLQHWDAKDQCFKVATEKAISDNSAIRTFRNGFELVNEQFLPETCDELLRLYNKAVLVKNEANVTVVEIQEPPKETLGDFLKQMIDEQKRCSGYFIQKPSSTYQQYLNLLRKLENEGRIIDVPLEEIEDKHFVQFRDYLLYQLNGVNYKNLMKWFIAVHNMAVASGKNDHMFKSKASKFAPKGKDRTPIRSLSLEQLAKFEEFDLSQLVNGCTPKKTVRQYELYRDFAIFMYEMKLRPIDTVKLTYDNIHVDDDQGIDFVEYVPEKKKNYKEIPIVQTPMTAKANAIVEKYKDQSSKGYIFPFALNEYDWDYTNPESYKRHYSKWNRLMEQINTFLHKMEKPLKFKGLTLYMFRHTAFTVACKEMKESYFEIASHGGTSVKMLEDHYVATGYNNAKSKKR